MRRSEATAKKAAELARDGKTIEAIMKLVEFADRGVNNHHTEGLFKDAIREEFDDFEFVEKALQEARN